MNSWDLVANGGNALVALVDRTGYTRRAAKVSRIVSRMDYSHQNGFVLSKETKAKLQREVRAYALTVTNKILRAEYRRLASGKSSRILEGVFPMRCAHCAGVIINIEGPEGQWYHFNDPPVHDGNFMLRIRCELKDHWTDKATPYMLDEAFS
jgi:hypothetical protein